MRTTIKYIILILMGLCFINVNAAEMSAQQKKEVIAKINKAASALKTMKCEFTQTKHLSLLSDKMISGGKMYYRQADKLRWEYTSPYSYLFIFNGTKVYVGGKSRKDVIDTKTNKVFKEVARIMMNTVTGKALSNSSDFSVDISSSTSYWIVTLIPKKKDLKQMFKKIVLNFTKSNTMISGINIYEKNGDRTNIKLKNITTNSKLNESLFAIPR